VRTLKTFQGTHILGASRGLLCDSSAVLLCSVIMTVIMIFCAEGKRSPGAHLVSWDRHGNPNQCFDIQFIGAPQPQPPPQPRYDIGHTYA